MAHGLLGHSGVPPTVRSMTETMTATATAISFVSRAVPVAVRPRPMTRSQVAGLLLLLPAAGFLLAFFVIPALTLFTYSLLTQGADGVVTLPLTLSHFGHFFGTTLYTHVLA